jgi:Ca-activated chloride channel family protein
MRRGIASVAALIVIIIVVLLVALFGAPPRRRHVDTRHPTLARGNYTDVPMTMWRTREEAPPKAPEGALPPLDEEVWVIARPSAGAAPAADEDVPGSGALIAVLPDGRQNVPVPLQHTDVKAHIAGYVATVDVTQQFHNPYDGKIEASYVFPLPQNAAVNEFVMTVGERRIVGLIRERAEAERIYAQARSEGYVASLLTQERPNVFTQKVANIEPGKQIDIHVRYFHTLSYVDGWYEYVFPMVVGPRFNPAGSTDGIGAVGRDSAGVSGQQTEVQYLKPTERSGHDIALRVDVDAGVPIEEYACRSHALAAEQPAPDRLTATLSPLDRIPNKDFVLRYKVAGEGVKQALLTHHDERGGYFTLMLYPPESTGGLGRRPLEMVFLIDCSGSMSGAPMAQAKAAVTRALARLQPGDSFQVIRFSMDASQLGSEPVEATAPNVDHATDYVSNLDGSGGTMMIEGIKAALDFPHDPERLRFVSFLTDGYIGNEAEILSEVDRRLGPSRIFSFGVGSSPNRYLLDRMARHGRGVVAYLGLSDSASDVMDLFFDRVSRPAMTDITIDWGGMQVSDVYPSRIPDLFVGRPVVLTGRYSGTGKAEITVNGSVGGRAERIVLTADLDDAGAGQPGLPFVWARMKITDLSARLVAEEDTGLAEQIKRVALDYGLMSAYTAFVAVDSSRRTEGEYGTTVAVPVPVPAGVRYETTVEE